MAQFGSTTLTLKGSRLLAKALAGATLHFTKMVFGDDVLAPNQDLTELTAINNPKMNLAIVRANADSGIFTLTGTYKNETLVEGFFTRIIGVYAEDPDEGEILYSVAYAGDKGDYIPAGGGNEILERTLDIKTVIHTAENITVVINDSAIYITRSEFESYTNSMPGIGSETTSLSHVYGQTNSNRKLDFVPFDEFKKDILGGDGSNITDMQGQIATLFRNDQEAALEREADGLAPGWSFMFAENFEDCDEVDVFSTTVQSVAGDDTILVSSVKGLLTGSWYTISDGVNQELIQIKSIIKNGTDLRVIATQKLQYTYQSGKTYMYRSTAQIVTTNGEALGAGDQRAKIWAPNITFSGVSGNVPQTATLDTSLSNPALTVTGDGAFTADGYFTLK